MLNVITHGTAAATPPLLIAHGLFGSARNWGVIARRLSDARQVIAVDMRNHGESPWYDSHSYSDMAADLAEVIAQFGGRADVVGHSMGGKAAMMLALNHPDAVARLVVADVAPVPYSHSQMQYIEAMRTVDLSHIERRAEAEAQLAEKGVERALQSFFTQSLDLKNRRWRLNLDTLAAEMPGILSFPQTQALWPGPTLFLAGEQSDYLHTQYRPQIRDLFPKAQFATLRNAEHWLHADQPRAFESALRAFLSL